MTAQIPPRAAVSVGIDLVDVARLRRLQARTPEFFARYFSPAEIAWARGHADPLPRFAEAFAAKEAFLKAMDQGVLDGVELRDLELRPGAGGTFALGISPAVMDRVGPVEARVTVSRTPDLACAVVVVEARPGRG